MTAQHMAPCDYTGGAPDGYRCDKCGAKGVKLWRDYSTFLEHQELTCAPCLRAYAASQGRHGEVDSDGLWSKPGDDIRWKSDSFFWRVPAVPTADGSTFWGYTSVPREGVAWWKRLPTLKEAP